MSKGTKRKRPVPLAPPPMKSRKKARKVTTLFHKYTRQRDAALEQGDSPAVLHWNRLIEEMGGREEYQRASQVSTSYHSTSKWVLGYLSRNGWLYGVPMVPHDHGDDEDNTQRKKKKRRKTRLLEVGAINTELLDAAAAKTDEGYQYRLDVRAIDIHSMHSGIELQDFLTMKCPSKNVLNRFDAIVCSMVLNCVTTPENRGEMICRLYHFLRPHGLCFLTIPKSCLTLSPFMDKEHFEQILRAVGFQVLETKESPKVSFFVCSALPPKQKPQGLDEKWLTLKPVKNGKKYRNDFAVILSQHGINGATLDYSD